MRRALTGVKLCVIPVLAGLLASSGWAAAPELPGGLAEALRRGAVRIQYEREAIGAVINGHGTAFGVDLSGYGYAGRRYLLTAAHNVLDSSKRPYTTLRVELRNGARTCWSACRAVAWDESLDLCVVEADDDLPQLLSLADRDPGVGSPLVLAGSPRGVPVDLFPGTLAAKFVGGTVRSTAYVAFDHGDSGGPMVEATTGRVVGVAVAGVPKDGDLAHDRGLFIPVVALTSFLEAQRATLLAPQASSTASAAPAGAPVPRPPEVLAPAAPTAFAAGNIWQSEVILKGLPPAGAPSAIPKPTTPAASAPVPPARDVASSSSSRLIVAESPTAGAPPAILSQVTPTVRAPAPVPAAREAAGIWSPRLVPKEAPSAGAPLAILIDLASPAAVEERACTYYMVQPGDNLTRIAREHGVSLQALIAANRIRNPNLLLAGTNLTIPAPSYP